MKKLFASLAFVAFSAAGFAQKDVPVKPWLDVSTKEAFKQGEEGQLQLYIKIKGSDYEACKVRLKKQRFTLLFSKVMRPILRRISLKQGQWQKKVFTIKTSLISMHFLRMGENINPTFRNVISILQCLQKRKLIKKQLRQILS